MANLHCHLKFGKQTSNYSLTSCEIELHQSQITKHYETYSTLLNRYRLPIVVLQIPQSLKAHKDFLFPIQALDMNKQTIQGQGKVYQMFNPNPPYINDFIHKIEKIFQKITQKTDNKLFLKAKLYDADNVFQKIIDWGELRLENVLNGFDIESEADLDNNFIKIVGELLGVVSPGFEQSPTIAGLELFSSMGIQAEFESPFIFGEEMRILAMERIPVFKSKTPEYIQTLTELINSKEIIHIYIHVRKLGYIHVQIEARFLTMLQILLSEVM